MLLSHWLNHLLLIMMMSQVTKTETRGQVVVQEAHGNILGREGERRDKRNINKEEEEEEMVWIWVVSSSYSSRQPPEEKKEEISHQQDSVDGPLKLVLQIRSHTRKLTLDLQLNREFLGPSMMDSNRCFYRGQIRGDLTSMAAVSVCGGLRGMLVFGGRRYEVTPAPLTHTLAGSHLLNTHRHTHKGACAVENHNHHHQMEEGGEGGRGRRVKRQVKPDKLWTQSNTTFVEMVVVVDKSLYTKVASSASDPSNSITHRVQALSNVVNALYRRLGIIVVLTHIEVWSREDMIKVVEGNSSATLLNLKGYFADFRKDAPNIPMDTMQLLTAVEFENNTLGKGFVGGMCGPQSVGVSTDKGKKGVVSSAVVMTHEIGHNLGLNHVNETEGCECNDGNCVMMKSGIGTEWNECSRKNITQLLKKLALDCLRNKPELSTTLLVAGGSGSCGDGVISVDEDCDCGPVDYCTNPCCEAATCKLAVNATCASGACCDLTTCLPLTSLTVCRAPFSECDVAEYCDGVTEHCAADQWHRDGVSCDGSRGYCYHGRCGSPTSRCVQVWGEDATPCSTQNYLNNNVKGEKHGNCGYENKAEEKLKACQRSNAECGTLLCHTPHDSHPRDFFIRTVWQSEENCRAILATPSYAESNWLVPDGSPCQDGKMCVQGECVTRPFALGTILFLLLLVICSLMVFCCWDHIRYCWERLGWRGCCHTHCYYCAACLDTFCCPCMNKINRLMLAVIPPLVCKCKSNAKKPVARRVSREHNGEGGGRGVAGAAEEVKEEEEGESWEGKLEFIQSPLRGVSFRPITPTLSPPTALPPPSPSLPTSSSSSNLLTTPINDSPPLNITPSRPAPPPPSVHTHTQPSSPPPLHSPPESRSPPSVPPRPHPSLIQSLRPPLKPPIPPKP